MTDFEDSDRETLTDRMRAAREKGVVALQSYNNLRSKVPGVIIIAVEGNDDPIYYRTLIAKIDRSFSWMPLVCNGKDKVLSLRALLGRNEDTDAKKTFYIIDRDFDNFKGHKSGPDIYCTDGYSIENNLVSEEALTELLCGEFKCVQHSDDVTKIAAIFRSRVDEFLSEMELANRALHWCRSKGVKVGSVENRIGKYVHISLDRVAAKYGILDLANLVGFPEEIDITSLSETSEAFNYLEPTKDWRGKFYLAFFVEFLARLQEDRSRKEPRVFSARRPINFNPKSSITRSLSSIAVPPPCLVEFVQRIAA